MLLRAVSSVLKQIKPQGFRQEFGEAVSQASPVKESLKSPLKKRPFLECWLIDDGSEEKLQITDELKELFEQQKYPLFSMRLEKNQGVSKARNLGIERAEGEWIAFLDSDDEWKQDKLLKQYEFIEKNPQYKILQSEETWIRNGKRVNPPKSLMKREGDFFFESLERCMITPSSVVIKSSLLNEEKFNETLLAGEDYDLWLRLTLFEPVGLVGEKLLIRYAGHGDQLSHRYPVMDYFRIKSLLLLKKKLLKDDSDKKTKKKIIHSKDLSEVKKRIDLVFYRKVKIIKNGARKRRRYFFLLKVIFLELLYPPG